jgi:pimeloyl-ACP methyl ester carboxylesterase
VLLGLAVTLIVVCGTRGIYQAVATAVDRRTYPPPGQLIDIGGYRLHISCIGQGSPTVILESGLQATSSLWGWAQPNVAGTTRVCAYDRAGVGWSEPASAPRDAWQIARELHTLLGNAGIIGPYVLVGHSYGGLYVRVYAAAYPDEVAGVVLVDASHPDQWLRTPTDQARYQELRLMYHGGRVLARLGLLRLGNVLPVIGDLPARQAMEYKAFADSTAFIDINDAEFLATAATAAQARDADTFGDKPLVVLTAADQRGFQFESGTGGFTARKERKQRGGWHWIAYRRFHGNVHKTYLGKSEEVTLARLQDAAALLAARIEVLGAPLTGAPPTVYTPAVRARRSNTCHFYPAERRRCMAEWDGYVPIHRYCG